MCLFFFFGGGLKPKTPKLKIRTLEIQDPESKIKTPTPKLQNSPAKMKQSLENLWLPAESKMVLGSYNLWGLRFIQFVGSWVHKIHGALGSVQFSSDSKEPLKQK